MPLYSVSYIHTSVKMSCKTAKKKKGGTGFIVTSKGNVHLHYRWITSIRSKQHSQVLEDAAILSSKNHLHLLPIIITDKATLSVYDAVVKQVNGSYRGR